MSELFSPFYVSGQSREIWNYSEMENLESSNKFKLSKKGFTLIELLIAITIIAVLAALIFSFSRKAMKKANGVKDMATMRGIWSLIPNYASDNNGMLPGPINSGQKSVYGEATTGRLSFYVADQLGYENPKRDDVLQPLVFSWQKTEAALKAPSFFMPSTIKLDNGTGDTIRPWGHPLRTGEDRIPKSLISVFSRIDPAREWAISDLDQQHPGVGNSGWKDEIPEEMSHGDYRIAIYFDGHAGKLDVNNEPK
ncbi:MAG: type II secretion system protein [Akkermansiaceae bacterium]